jgi:transcriptional regulator with XRE-family HTH domain
MNTTLGKRIKQARISANISQETLAELINKSAPTIRKYENGERNPPLSVVKEISTVLNIDLSKLVTEDSTLISNTSNNSNLRDQLNSLVDSFCVLYNKENTLSSSEIDDLQEIISKVLLFKLK